MKTYHIVYFETPDTYHSKGVNVEAHSMIEALKKFEKEYSVEPYYIMTK